MTHGSHDVILLTPALQQAYAPVLFERKVAKIRKSMDEEKARRVEIRSSMDATDRQ
jgi:hypothetical protein